MDATIREWFIVLRPDGVVELAEGASVTWIGHTLTDAPGVPEAVRRAAEELLRDSDGFYLRRRRVRGVHDARGPVDVELVVLEAVPLRRVHTPVNELVARTLDVFAAQARSSEIVLDVQHGPGVPPALVIDGEKIAWVLATLVGNALRYAQVPRERASEARVDVHIDWDASRNEVVMTVEDNGPGMPRQQVRWLFDRDPASGRAAGLALVMVRDVVIAHRGSIAVTSAVGEGTVFTIRLPRVK